MKNEIDIRPIKDYLEKAKPIIGKTKIPILNMVCFETGTNLRLCVTNLEAWFSQEFKHTHSKQKFLVDFYRLYDVVKTCKRGDTLSIEKESIVVSSDGINIEIKKSDIDIDDFPISPVPTHQKTPFKVFNDETFFKNIKQVCHACTKEKFTPNPCYKGVMFSDHKDHLEMFATDTNSLGLIKTKNCQTQQTFIVRKTGLEDMIRIFSSDVEINYNVDGDMFFIESDSRVLILRTMKNEMPLYGSLDFVKDDAWGNSIRLDIKEMVERTKKTIEIIKRHKKYMIPALLSYDSNGFHVEVDDGQGTAFDYDVNVLGVSGSPEYSKEGIDLCKLLNGLKSVKSCNFVFHGKYLMGIYEIGDTYTYYHCIMGLRI